jgi:hypothetical protein
MPSWRIACFVEVEVGDVLVSCYCSQCRVQSADRVRRQCGVIQRHPCGDQCKGVPGITCMDDSCLLLRCEPQEAALVTAAEASPLLSSL